MGSLYVRLGGARDPDRISNPKRSSFEWLSFEFPRSNSFPVNNIIDYCLLIVYASLCSRSKAALSSLFPLAYSPTAIST